MPRTAFALISCIVLPVLVVDARAEGGYHPPSEMIRRSQFIAIIVIDHVALLPKTEHPRWWFGQRAHAVVERNIKGALPHAIDIYGDENFVCQQTELSPGRYLAFLVEDRGRLHSSNYQMGIRPIRDDRVEWYHRGGDRLSAMYGYKLRWQRLDPLLRRINGPPRPNQSLLRTPKAFGVADLLFR